MPESSPAACRFAIRDKTAFCALLAGLLKIDSALTLVSFAGRDDTDRFFFVMFILHAIDVNNQQHRAGGGSYGVPPLLAGHDAVLAKIVLGSLKISAALSNARPSCFCWFVRFLSMSHSNASLYEMYNIPCGTGAGACCESGGEKKQRIS